MLRPLLVLATLCQHSVLPAPSIGVFLPQACVNLPARQMLLSTVSKVLESASSGTRIRHTKYDSCQEAVVISKLVSLLSSGVHDVIVGPGHSGTNSFKIKSTQQSCC